MRFTQGRGLVVGELIGLPCRSLRWSALGCHAADTASLAMRFLFGKLLGVATRWLRLGRCRENLPLAAQSTAKMFVECPFCHKRILRFWFAIHARKHTQLLGDGQMTDHIIQAPDQR